MSGGALDYISYEIDRYLVGKMEDRELNDLMVDISELAHELEWYYSGDTNKSDYVETVNKFKAKWFKGSRNERLKSYIDQAINETRNELYKLINE